MTQAVTTKARVAPAAPTVWTIDPAHTTVEFAVKHLMISTVRGRFRPAEVRLVGEPDEPLSARAEAVIDAGSVDTGNGDRDAHLRSADFFDTEHFPTLRYLSGAVSQTGEGEFEVDGELTIRGVTRPVTLSVTLEGVISDPWGNERLGLSAEGKIKRSDFDLTWNMALEAGGVVVGDDVRITIHAEAVRQPA